MTKTIELTDEHIYQVIEFKMVEGSKIPDHVGDITLLNTVTQEQETYFIWGDVEEDDLYVCLPTVLEEEREEVEDDLEVYSLDTFNVHLSEDLKSFVQY